MSRGSPVIIPGLELVSVENENEGLELESFTGLFQVPESHRYGKCRPYTSFEKISTLEEGKFGKIYKCQDKKNQKLILLKKYENCSYSDDSLTTMLHELDILNNLKHENIVNLVETVSGKNVDCICLAQEFCEFSLFKLMKEKCHFVYEPSIVKYIMKSLLVGLSYIHLFKVIHRNISTQNIMFNDSGVLKIANFEDSCHSLWRKKPGHIRSPLCYQAPEILLEAPDYDVPVDIWSAGCVMAELLHKKSLFDGKSSLEVLKVISSHLEVPTDVTWPGFSQLPLAQELSMEGSFHNGIQSITEALGHSKECCSLLAHLLVFCPEKRYKAKVCRDDIYFKTEPVACSVEDMAMKLNTI